MNRITPERLESIRRASALEYVGRTVEVARKDVAELLSEIDALRAEIDEIYRRISAESIKQAESMHGEAIAKLHTQISEINNYLNARARGDNVLPPAPGSVDQVFLD